MNIDNINILKKQVKKNKLIIFICNMNNSHWLCCCFDPVKKKVFVVDSLRSMEYENSNYYPKELITFIQSRLVEGEIEVIVSKVPNQIGNWECGWRVMHFLNIQCRVNWGTFEPLEDYYQKESFDEFLVYISKLYKDVKKCEANSGKEKMNSFQLFCRDYSQHYL